MKARHIAHERFDGRRDDGADPTDLLQPMSGIVAVIERRDWFFQPLNLLLGVFHPVQLCAKLILDTDIVYEPQDFMAKLAALVPAPRVHLTRFHGILAPAAKWRPWIVPKPPPTTNVESAVSAAAVPISVQECAPVINDPAGVKVITKDTPPRRNYAWASAIAVVFAQAVRARRTEIGLRRAMGATSGDILCQVWSEGLLISLLGGASGFVIGWVAAEQLAAWRSRAFGVDGIVIIIPIALALVSSIAGIIPARVAAKLDPADSLPPKQMRFVRFILVALRAAGSVLSQNRWRSLLTLSICASGTAGVMTAGVLAEINLAEMRSRLAALGGNLLVVSPNKLPPFPGRARQLEHFISLVSEDAAALKTLTGAEAAVPVVFATRRSA